MTRQMPGPACQDDEAAPDGAGQCSHRHHTVRNNIRIYRPQIAVSPYQDKIPNTGKDESGYGKHNYGSVCVIHGKKQDAESSCKTDYHMYSHADLRIRFFSLSVIGLNHIDTYCILIYGHQNQYLYNPKNFHNAKRGILPLFRSL